MRKSLFKFECKLCKESSFNYEAKFVAHLDIIHPNIELEFKNDLINEFKIEKLENEIKNKVLELTQLKNELIKLSPKNENIELKLMKNEVIESLKDTDIDSKSLKIINNRKSIQKLKIYLSRGLRKKYRINLENFGIDYKVPFKKKKKRIKKKKMKKETEYFDRTTSSIRPIYTPMGNRR